MLRGLAQDYLKLLPYSLFVCEDQELSTFYKLSLSKLLHTKKDSLLLCL